jgi:hypothetical protein
MIKSVITQYVKDNPDDPSVQFAKSLKNKSNEEKNNREST